MQLNPVFWRTCSYFKTETGTIVGEKDVQSFSKIKYKTLKEKAR